MEVCRSGEEEENYLVIINIHESNRELGFQVLEAQQWRSGAAGHKLEERGGEGGRGDAALLSIAASFLHALHLKEEPFLLFVEVTAENVPEPQDHTMSGMVSSVVHRVVPEGEEEGVEGEEEGEGRRGRRGWRRGRRGRRKGSRGRRREFSNHTSTL